MDPLVKGLLDEFRREQGIADLSESDAFEVFAASLVLPPDVLQQIELSDVLLDEATPGVDVAVLDVNGRVVLGLDDVAEACEGTRHLEVTLHLVQAKTSPRVDSSQLLNMGNIAKSIVQNNLLPGYDKLGEVAAAFREILTRFAGKLRNAPSVLLHYVCTANDDAITDGFVTARTENVREELSQAAYLGDVRFELHGARALHHAVQRRSFANEIDVRLEKAVNLPPLPGVDQAILGIISVSQLLKLIQDESGGLDERVFYDNVRGFKGSENRVNTQIVATLESEGRALLPVLNNGVTVVAASYSPKPGDTVTLSGYQIVNGCQTSNCVYLARDALSSVGESVYVPLRIVVTEDQGVANRIIRATNSQTEVGDGDLVALTDFQKELETFYQSDPLRTGLTYERRSGQFYDQNVTWTRIVTRVEQMRAVAAVFLDLPHLAARYPQHLYEEVGKTIFVDGQRLAPYLASAYVAYRLESAFRWNLESEYKPIRYHILMAYRREVLGSKKIRLNEKRIDEDCQLLVDSLSGNDYVSRFRKVARRIVEVADGQVPTRDRLKGARFTGELVSVLDG